MRHRRPPRLPEFEYVGPVRIFMTMCTFHRRRHFVSHHNVDLVRREFLRTALDQAVEIVAYCFMPDHLHALAEGQADRSNLLHFMDRFRQRAGLAYKKDQRERLWQEGYFDEKLVDEDATYDVVSYILANPVRAGLCRSAVEYPFSGSQRYSLDEIALSVQWRPRRSLG
jgi:putative transposase